MNNKKRPSITIGIPAYNEESNIGFLLRDLLTQYTNGISLDTIMVYSDGSTDGTAKVVKNIDSKKIVLINKRKRKGVARGINTIFSKAQSDMVVILNADIRITDRNFLKKLVAPIVHKGADLTSCALKAVKPHTLVEEVLYVSTIYKDYLFENYKNSNNLYTCHGPARAFSKKFYKNIFIRESVAEDMYSYLYCIAHGYSYSYVKDTFVYFKLPDNLNDYKRQSIRFSKARKRIQLYFNKTLIFKESYLPLELHLKAALTAFRKNSFYMFLFGVLYVYVTLISYFSGKEVLKDKWQVAKSSKAVDINH